MPVKSAKQFRFMQTAAHGALKGAGGPSEGTAKEFLDKTSKKKKHSFASAYKEVKKY